jgi:hypothetical protein
MIVEAGGEKSAGKMKLDLRDLCGRKGKWYEGRETERVCLMVLVCGGGEGCLIAVGAAS